MDTLSNTLFQTEFSPFAPAPHPDAVEPLPCDRWLAASALQKAIRRGDALTAQRAVRTLYRYDPRSAWRRLLVIACEDIGIGALGAVIVTTLRSATAKTRDEAGGDEAAALQTAQMLAAAPKDRSADLLFAAVLHDPALENARSKCRSVSLARRLEFVSDPTSSLPERALAAWHSSGVEERGERRVGPGDLTRRRPLPALSGDRGAQVLALRPDRPDPAALWDRATPAADRGGAHRRHERVQCMGGVRRPLLRHTLGLSRPRASQVRTQGPVARGRQGSLRPRRTGQAVEVGRGQL
jgi:hypothetical protein